MNKRKYVKKIMLVLCIVCFACIVCMTAMVLRPFALPHLLREIHDAKARDARESVVLLCAQDSVGNVRWGSGFAIGEQDKPIQFIATNCGVIDEHSEPGNPVQVYYSKGESSFINAEVYWKNTDMDLAVLRLPEPTAQRKAVVLCTSTSIDLDGTFSALEYLRAANSDDNSLPFDQSDITRTKCGIQKQTRLNGADVYLLDLAVQGGNAGGPLVNAKGQAVGIMCVQYEHSKVQYYAIAVDELLRNIGREDLPQITY